MRIRVGIAVAVVLAAIVLAGAWFAPVSADAKRYRVCVYVDRDRPNEPVIVDDLRVNEAIFDEGGLQYIWVHGAAGNFQLHFELIRQIEILKWLGKDPSRDDYARYSVKVTGTAEEKSYFGTWDIRVMRGLAGKAPWYYFPITQADRGLSLWRVTFGQDCFGPTIPIEAPKPPALPETLVVVTAKPLDQLPPPPPIIDAAVDNFNPDELQDIFFDYDKWDLRQASIDTLTRNAQWMKRWPTTRILIEGQADPRGTNEYNFPLGLHRANAARDYLISLGIAPDRLVSVTMGETNLVCTEQTEECWQRNRRSHFILLSR